jgi:hypothetical protein
MFGEISGWSRLGFKSYLFMERQFSWLVISVHKNPHYYPATTRLTHRLQVCYWKIILRRSTRRHCKPEFRTSLSFYEVFWSICAVCEEMGWEFLLIHLLSKFPTLPFCLSFKLRDIQASLLYSYAPTIHKAVAQSHSTIHIYQTVQNPHQCSVISYRVSRRHIQLNITKSNEKERIYGSCLSVIVLGFTWENLWRRGCHSGAVGAVLLGDDSRRFEAMHCGYFYESSRLSRILHSFFPVLFETSLNTPATTDRILVNNICRDSFSCTVCNEALGALHSALYSAIWQRGWLICDKLERM